MEWNAMPAGELLGRLEPPKGKIRMVLDTDTYNEVDDQFAMAYALLSPERLSVEAIYAAPFHNDRSSGPGDGMRKSLAEIRRLLGAMGRPAGNDFVFEGSESYLPGAREPADSPAARDLIRRAMAMPEGEMLHVVAIGAITNVASALLMEPKITRKIAVTWLGGNPLGYPDTREFNLMQDVPAARVLLDSGAPVTLVPCMGVASNMLATAPDMREYLGGKNALCDALVELFCAYSKEHFGWAKEVWDVAAVARLINPGWVPAAPAPAPLLTDDCHWAADARRHPVNIAYMAHRTPIFRDMYLKLASLA